MFPPFDLTHGKARSSGQFWLGKVGFDPFQEQVVTLGFEFSWNELTGTESLLEIGQVTLYGALCNSQQLTPKLWC
jgi:hypothetical protein